MQLDTPDTDEPSEIFSHDPRAVVWISPDARKFMPAGQGLPIVRRKDTRPGEFGLA